jgi:ribonuclease HII/SAM-dependent methyltransferase
VQDGFRESIQSLVQQLLAVGENDTTTIDNADDGADAADTKRRMEIANNNDKTKKGMFCSIVDGQRSPSFPDLTSRPWPQADSTVYTVAVAGILARAIHAEIMTDYQTQQFATDNDDDESSLSSKSSSSFRDRWDGGYPTPGHLLALATHGPTPWHRQSCKPVQQFRDRRSTLLSAVSLLPFLLLTTTTTVLMSSDPANAMVRERGMLLPERGEIAAAVPTDWSEIDAVKEPLGRLDDNDDAIFYQEERFVEHIDDTAVGALRAYLATVVNSPTLSVLDVGASWTSHLEASTIIISNRRKVVGIGLNAKELAANTVLSDRLVQNLNIKTTLPLDSDSFDIALCQLTIDYLTRPIAVCNELRRVLKKKKEPTAGMIHVVFSNRLFIQKAVDNWTGRDDLDHVETVASYLHYAGFRNIKAQDLSIRNKRGSIMGDPLYVVRAEA